MVFEVFHVRMTKADIPKEWHHGESLIVPYNELERILIFINLGAR